MKKQFLLILSILFSIHFVFGGGYSCHRFKVMIETETNNLIVGFTEFGDDFRNYNDSELLKYLKENYKFPHDTLIVYDTIYSIKYPKMSDYELTAILYKDIIKISIDEIKNIKSISKSPYRGGRFI